jgi:hypothetical protein
MPDFKKIVQERIACLRLEAGAESDLAAELALKRRCSSLRCSRFTAPLCERSNVDLFRFAMTYSLCLYLPGSAQLATVDKLSGGVEPAFCRAKIRRQILHRCN